MIYYYYLSNYIWKIYLMNWESYAGIIFHDFWFCIIMYNISFINTCSYKIFIIILYIILFFCLLNDCNLVSMYEISKIIFYISYVPLLFIYFIYEGLKIDSSFKFWPEFLKEFRSENFYHRFTFLFPVSTIIY